jgi:hypothetical protein
MEKHGLMSAGDPGRRAVTPHLPGDYPTIQQAIDAAAPGDKVLVDPGTYVENIDFLGKAITVKANGNPGTVVIDGGMPIDPDRGSVVTFKKYEGPDSVLEGFILTHGTGTRNIFSLNRKSSVQSQRPPGLL